MKDTLVKSIKDVMAEMATQQTASPQLVADWKSMIPPDSNWHPNDPGDPFCKKCDGSGYIRLAGLPVGHPYFGKILFCECAEQKVRQWEARKAQESDVDQLRSMPAYLR